MKSHTQPKWRTSNPEGWNISDVTCDILEPMLLAKAAKANMTPAIVWDLDGTLFDVNHRTLGIIREWAANLAADAFNSEHVEVLRNLDISKVGYDVPDTFHAAGLDSSVPEIETMQHLCERAWKRRFFDGQSMLELDEPNPGATEWVKRFHAKGIRQIYLSGRHRRVMVEGTLAQLTKAGFPLENFELVLKEESRFEDSLFKPQALGELRNRYAVIGNFENEYVNLAGMARACPSALHVLLDAPHSKRPVSPLEIPVFRIPCFRC